MSDRSVSIVIPAYQPGEALVELVRRLSGAPISAVVVVNDGSDGKCRALFDAIRCLPRVHVLDHAVNLGKGAALKTGINYALCNFPDDCGVVTADADGQHDPEDVLRVAALLGEHPDSLILGVRQFETGVPLRSRLGNRITQIVQRAIVGQNLADTQTGLRGIPRRLAAQLLRMPSNGYEFELDMLIACKHQSLPIVQVPIRTIYLPGNPSSHFNPLIDSMKIYFVLLRFGMISFLTAVLDNAIFVGVFRATGILWESQVLGRVGALVFNYSAARRAVFLSRERHLATLPKYLLLVALNGVISYAMINILVSRFGVAVPWAKILAESILFLAHFTLQRDFIFMKGRGTRPLATDWDQYYTSVPFTARLTRKYTTRVLISSMQRFSPATARIIEIGGANSCFLDKIFQQVQPRQYHVIDSNQYGLDLLEHRATHEGVVTTRMDVLDVRSGVVPAADLVFSIGLVEHFDPAGTRQAINAHFELLKPGGCAIISFPTPTWLYRAARSVCETLGLWKFPDERPLHREEVLTAALKYGEVLFEKTLWPLVFTQRMIVVRKA
jgi:glycosyltransferase involved in cell wall biosynthesis